MFNSYNPYNTAPPSVDRINSQIAELERMRNQVQNQQVQPSINQTFQLAPNQASLRMVDSIEEVNKDFVIGDTPFFNKDLTTMWLKNAKGDIRIFNLTEIIPKDEKDLIIEQLQKQIQEMSTNANNASIDDATSKSIEDEKSKDVRAIRTTKKK